MTALETTEIIITIIVSIATVLSMVALSIRWMVKQYLGEIKSELKPNGGGSIKDQVNRLEKRIAAQEAEVHISDSKIDRLEEKIDDLYNHFIKYISNK